MHEIVLKLLKAFLFISRYGTKIKNCSGFMRVHRILKVWSLLTTKIIISPKQVLLKRSTAQIPAAPLVHKDPPLKIFSKQEFIENLEFFGKPASYPFRKVIYVPTNNLKLQSYSINSILALPIFSKFHNEVQQTLCRKLNHIICNS